MNNAAEAITATGFFLTVIITVKSIASVWLKRLEARRGAVASDAQQRLERIEAAVDVIALEVERIAEAQRYTLRLAEGARPPKLGEGPVVTPH